MSLLCCWFPRQYGFRRWFAFFTLYLFPHVVGLSCYLSFYFEVWLLFIILIVSVYFCWMVLLLLPFFLCWGSPFLLTVTVFAFIVGNPFLDSGEQVFFTKNENIDTIWKTTSNKKIDIQYVNNVSETTWTVHALDNIWKISTNKLNIQYMINVSEYI